MGDCFQIQLPPLSPEDPLFQQKTDILNQKGLSLHFSVAANESNGHCKAHLDAMLSAARILNLNEIEWYFLENDTRPPINFRNELEAMNTVHISLEGVSNANSNNSSVHILLEMALQKLESFCDQESMPLVNQGVNDKDRRFLEWAQHEGIDSKLDVAVFDGFGRGGRAAVDINVDDIVMKIPQHLLICEDSVLNTDMEFPLKEMELSGETKALLWTMRERHNPSSKFAPYFASLPAYFNTGLSFGVSALKALDGTMVFEELIQAKEHLRWKYEELFPVLSHRYPTIFPEENFTWNMFLWACELWYSNGLKVAYSQGDIKTCLVPFVGLLNHSLSPHVTHYSKLDNTSKALILRSARPCRAGKQCFLSYGPLSNSHLLLFYGFMLSQNNPYDIVPIDLDLSSSPDRLALIERWKFGTSHMVRGMWLSPSRIPSRLISTLCIAFMDEDEARSLSFASDEEQVAIVMSLESKRKAYEFLWSLLSSMLDQLGDCISTEDMKDHEWDMKLAISFKNQQQKLLQSVCDHCSTELRSLDC